MDDFFSIIIRTKNEERWISACLRKIQQQTLNEFEVILVDNVSTDKTVDRALSTMASIKVATLDEYLPGKALNLGARIANGNYLVCLSSHCIPENENWLKNLYANFKGDPLLAGVYGRQIPMHFSSDQDKRDLLVTFGLDKRTQHKDPFFHNANSMIPRLIWEKYPFNEVTPNIEDRLWAKEVLAAGFQINYEPDAAVFHYHGIYQDQNLQRVRSTIKIIEADSTASYMDKNNPMHPTKLNIAAIIPVREEPRLDFPIQKKLLRHTILAARDSRLVSNVIISTASKRMRETAIEFGAIAPFLRPEELIQKDVPVIDVLKHCLEWHENQSIYFDYLVTLEITHPFRPAGLIDRCIENALENNFNCALAGYSEYRPGWWRDGNDYRRIDDLIHKRSEREPIQIGLPALCTVLIPSLIRNNQRISNNAGIVELDDPLAMIEVRENQDYEQIKNVIGDLIG
jgi:glycosyltransferase involved in cell wall biosynthesis